MLQTVYIIGIAIPILNFLDFLIGPKGDKQLRNLLVITWVALQDDWRLLYQAPANLVSLFLSHALGATWFKKTARIFLYTAVLVLAITVLADITDFVKAGSAGDEIQASGILALLSYRYYIAKIQFQVIPNFLGDLLSWTCTMYLIAQTAKSGTLRATLNLILMTMVGFSAFIVSDLLHYVINHHNWYQMKGSGLTQLLDRAVLASRALLNGRLNMLSEGRPIQYFYPASGVPYPGRSGGVASATQPIAIDDTNDPLYGSPVFDSYDTIPILTFIPLIIYLFCMSGALVLVWLRPFVKKPLLYLLERIDASPKPLLTCLGIAFVGVLELLKAVAKKG